MNFDMCIYSYKLPPFKIQNIFNIPQNCPSASFSQPFPLLPEDNYCSDFYFPQIRKLVLEIYMQLQSINFCVWFLFLNIVVWRFIHMLCVLVVCSVLLLNNVLFYHNLFIHYFVNRHLIFFSCFWLLCKAAVNRILLSLFVV